jgi:hypothetical protein
MSKFTSCLNKGFQMTFDNGFRISVQWGHGNYCAVKNKGMWGDEQKEDYWDSTSAEIAVFGEGDNMLNLRGDDSFDTVVGWLSTDEVAKVIAIVQSSKTDKEIELKCKALNL